MFHCNGWCFTWAVTAMGARHVCLRKVDHGAMWELFEREGITHYNAAPTVHLGVVYDPAAHRVERGLIVTTGGAPPSPTLLARMEELNFRLVHVYGLTETYAPAHGLRVAGVLGRSSPRTSARAWRAVRASSNIVSDPIRVVDAEMNDVPATARPWARS